jgi:2'-hydroxyisoflavone reductase
VNVLVLGGTRFVGRAVVDEALARGWDVTAVHRGRTGGVPPGVTTVLADRRSGPELTAALGPGGWDLVVDTWSGEPSVAALTARLLRGRVGRYGYVSSASVYQWGGHVDEGSPVVEAEGDGYPALKRGAELGVLASHHDALLARAGLILGPHEDIGRLPWWLERVARGGAVVAPGRPDRPLQYVDARDLASWLWSSLAAGVHGPVDVASRSGHATTRSLLEAVVSATGADAELVWVSESDLAAAGAQPWTQLPCWVPEGGDFAGFLEVDTSFSAATGLLCRPIADTVADTWTWLRRAGKPQQRPDREVHGLPVELERQILALAR